MKHPEEHPDEGTIHAWLDDALEPNEASELEAHVSVCADCSAMVAEARGLIAAASRVVSQLDGVPAQVVPSRVAPIASRAAASNTLRTTTRSRSWWRYSGVAAAAVFFMVSATWVSTRAPQSGVVRDAMRPQATIDARAPESASERKRESAEEVAVARPLANAPLVDPVASVMAPQRSARRAPTVSQTPSPQLAAVTVASTPPAAVKSEATVIAANDAALSAMSGCYSLSPAMMIAGGSARGVVAAPPAGGAAASARMARPQAAFAASPSSTSVPQLRLTDSLTSGAIDSRSADAVARDASAREQAAIAYIGYASGLIPRNSVMSDAPTGNAPAGNAQARNAPSSNTLVRWSALSEDLLRVQLLDGASVLVRVAPDGLRSSTTLPRADFTARRTACP